MAPCPLRRLHALQRAGALLALWALTRGRVLVARFALPVGLACDASCVRITRRPLFALRFQRRPHPLAALRRGMRPTLSLPTHVPACPQPPCGRALRGAPASCWAFRFLASPASCALTVAVRCRLFGWLAPALPVFVGLGSPARTACASGSSLPTTARPLSHVTHPATDNGRGCVRSAHRRDSLRLPPPP